MNHPISQWQIKPLRRPFIRLIRLSRCFLLYDNARWEITFRFRDERQAILEDAMREGART